jgi:4-amino-4-deoxy-L-arabinose transferase-like glycosyltransferase
VIEMTGAESGRHRGSALPRRTELLWLVVIVAIGGVLRLGWPGVTEFKADEARLLELAFDLAEGVRFPLRGIDSSVGVPNPAMSVWIYSLPLLAWKHVIAATLFTGLLNTLAIIGCWWFARRYWGAMAGLAAALMFAASPWAISYSRKIWAQNLLPFFVVVWIISAGLALLERRPRWTLVHLVSLAILVQIHFSAVAFVPVTILFLILFRRRVRWRMVMIGGGLAVLTLAPFLIYLFRDGAGLEGLANAVRTSEARTDLGSWRYTWLISTGREIHSLAGSEAYQDFLSGVPDVGSLQAVWGAMILAGLGWLAWHAVRRPGDETAQAGALVLIWGLAPSLVFLRHSFPLFPHYFITTFPAQYIAAGVVVAALTSRVRWMGWVLLGASSAAQVGIWIALLIFLNTHGTPGGFGIPLRVQLEAVDMAERVMAEEGAGEILVAGGGEDPAVDESAAVHAVLLRSTPHRFVDVDHSAVFPAGPAVVLVYPASGALAGLYQAASSRIEKVALREGEGEIMILALPSEGRPPAEFGYPQPNRLANGVTLLGYDSPIELGEDILWQIHWQTGASADVDYHFFNHLMDSKGQRVSQADAAAFSASQWHPGDEVISRFSLPKPAGAVGPLSMRTGMYTYPAVENVPVLDIASNPCADAVVVSLP